MGLTEAEAESYAKDVVRSDFEEAGDHDVIRKVLGDLTAAGVDCDEDKVTEALRNKEIEARRQIIEAIQQLMPMPASEIERLIKAAIPDAEVTIRDLAGDGDHYAARVVSAMHSTGISRIKQHQAVYAALSPSNDALTTRAAQRSPLPARSRMLDLGIGDRLLDQPLDLGSRPWGITRFVASMICRRASISLLRSASTTCSSSHSMPAAVRSPSTLRITSCSPASSKSDRTTSLA